MFFSKLILVFLSSCDQTEDDYTDATLWYGPYKANGWNNWVSYLAAAQIAGNESISNPYKYHISSWILQYFLVCLLVSFSI